MEIRKLITYGFGSDEMKVRAPWSVLGRVNGNPFLGGDQS
jgi:hypothetical protein